MCHTLASWNWARQAASYRYCTHLITVFQDKPGKLEYWSKDDGDKWWHQCHCHLGDNWSWKRCSAPVKSSQTNQHPVFLQTGCPSCRPTNSVKALNGKYHIPWTWLLQAHLRVFQLCLWPLIAPGYLGEGCHVSSSDLWPRAGSGVVRIDPLHFLVGCRTRRLNQAISVLYLSMFYCIVAY